MRRKWWWKLLLEFSVEVGEQFGGVGEVGEQDLATELGVFEGEGADLSWPLDFGGWFVGRAEADGLGDAGQVFGVVALNNVPFRLVGEQLELVAESGVGLDAGVGESGTDFSGGDTVGEVGEIDGGVNPPGVGIADFGESVGFPVGVDGFGGGDVLTEGIDFHYGDTL